MATIEFRELIHVTIWGKGDRGRCREAIDFQRGEMESVGINSRSAKRKMEVDIGEVKRGHGNNEIAGILLILDMGWPKFLIR